MMMDLLSDVEAAAEQVRADTGLAWEFDERSLYEGGLFVSTP